MKLPIRIRAALHYRKVFKDCSHICLFCRHRQKICDYRNPYVRFL